MLLRPLQSTTQQCIKLLARNIARTPSKTRGVGHLCHLLNTPVTTRVNESFVKNVRHSSNNSMCCGTYGTNSNITQIAKGVVSNGDTIIVTRIPRNAQLNKIDSQNLNISNKFKIYSTGIITIDADQQIIQAKFNESECDKISNLKRLRTAVIPQRRLSDYPIADISSAIDSISSIVFCMTVFLFCYTIYRL